LCKVGVRGVFVARPMDRNDIPIPTPCRADWDTMSAGDRWCAECQKHVHDLSAMTSDQARALLTGPETEGLCVRYLCDTSGVVVFQPQEPEARLIAPGRGPAEGGTRKLNEGTGSGDGARCEAGAESPSPGRLTRLKRYVGAAAALLPMSLTACMGAYVPPPPKPAPALAPSHRSGAAEAPAPAASGTGSAKVETIAAPSHRSGAAQAPAKPHG